MAGRSGLAVGVTGVYGLVMDNYRPIIMDWAIGGPFIGAVVTYYLGPRRTDAG